jgi:hypothetical protein
MATSVDDLLEELEGFERRIFDLAKEMFEPGKTYLYHLDLLANAVMDRMVSTIFGFTSQIRSDNYTCAAPLVRMHIDSLMRFYASYISDDPHDFTQRVFRGEHISKIKDREGKAMRDFYLVDKLSESYPWIKKVYEETSGYVHLSDKHIFNSSKLEEYEQGIISFTIGKTDRNLSNESKIEAISCMIEITEIQLSLLGGWADHKREDYINRKVKGE